VYYTIYFGLAIVNNARASLALQLAVRDRGLAYGMSLVIEMGMLKCKGELDVLHSLPVLSSYSLYALSIQISLSLSQASL